jgi:hypothetical protein
VVGSQPDSGTIRLYIDGERSTRNTITARNIGDGAQIADNVLTPAVSLATVLEGGCDLLKIDCEGAEFEMLENTPAPVLAKAQRVVLEFHRQFGSDVTLLDHLEAAGFAARIISEHDEFGVIGAVHS